MINQLALFFVFAVILLEWGCIAWFIVNFMITLKKEIIEILENYNDSTKEM